jgi:O-antigen/teichoic acid export membrane protein
MGIIQKQSIQSTGIIMFGFAIGAINMIILAPKVLTAEELGLTRIITDAGLTLATMCTLGSIPIVIKFFPFYKSYLKKEKNDLPFVTLLICMVGFLIMCLVGFSASDVIVRKFSERSPLFVEYSYLVFPFGFLMLLFIWMESFSWSLQKGVISNIFKETVTRIFFTILLVLLTFELINLHSFFTLFSILYFLPVVLLFISLRKTGNFPLVSTISPVTWRLKYKMANLGLFIFGAQFLNLLSRTVDTFLLSSKSSGGLKDAAIFTIATYVVTLMEVPQRSITSISVSVISESWKNKDLKKISNIYSKSVTNLLIIGLIMYCIVLLNIHNLGIYLGPDYRGIEYIVIFMGTAKLIDLGTGVNSQIIGTSNYWKVDFTTNVIYTLIALPLNYYLIDRYELRGAAYSSLISIGLFNLMRFGFLWWKFGLQPYSLKHVRLIVLAVVSGIIVYMIPHHKSIIIDTIIRTLAFSILFIPAMFYMKISDEVNGIILSVLARIGIRK